MNLGGNLIKLGSERVAAKAESIMGEHGVRTAQEASQLGAASVAFGTSAGGIGALGTQVPVQDALLMGAGAGAYSSAVYGAGSVGTAMKQGIDQRTGKEAASALAGGRLLESSAVTAVAVPASLALTALPGAPVGEIVSSAQVVGKGGAIVSLFAAIVGWFEKY